MAEEEPAQHDSDDEWLWLAELLSPPRSSLPRPQTAKAVSSAGEAESAPGSAAHVAAGSSAGAGSTAGSLPAAGPRSSSGGSASDGRTCHPCPRCGRECDAYCTCVAKHEWDSPCAPWPPRCPRQCSVWKSRQCDLPWGHEEACCCGCSVPDDSTLGTIRYQRRAEERPSANTSKSRQAPTLEEREATYKAPWPSKAGLAAECVRGTETTPAQETGMTVQDGERLRLHPYSPSGRNGYKKRKGSINRTKSGKGTSGSSK